MAKFKKEILDKIKTDPDLYTLVVKAMEIQPSSLGVILERNGKTLNQYSVVKVVADYLKKDPSEILEEGIVNQAQN